MPSTPEEKLTQTLLAFAKKQERTTLYQSEGVWFMEWFTAANTNGRSAYHWESDKDPVRLIKRVVKL